VNGSPDDLRRFYLKAKGRTQNYNDFSKNAWEAFDDIRVRSILETTPELGNESDFSFHRLYPVPDKVMRLPYDRSRAESLLKRLGLSTEGLQTGYDWENDNWGHKWGCTDVSACHEKSEDGSFEFLNYCFETPWAPPIPFMNEVSKDFPSLSFVLNYEEPGMAFEGKAIWEDGECMFDDTWEMEEEEYSEE